MMQQAAKLPSVQHDNIRGYVRADAEAMPFPAKSVDCVMSIRFLFHVDPQTRRRMLREFGRVSRRWIIADYRHKYSFRLWHLEVHARAGSDEAALRTGLRQEHEIRVRGCRTARGEDHRRAPLALGQVGGAGRIRPHRPGKSHQEDWRARSTRTLPSPTSSARASVRSCTGAAGRAAMSASRYTSPRPSRATRASTNCRSPSSRTGATRPSSRRAACAKYVAEPLGFVVEPGFQMSHPGTGGRRGVLLRAARSRATSFRRASWTIWPSS